MSKISDEKLEELKAYPLCYQLQKLRCWSNYTQKDAADHLKCNQASISAWEQGKRYPNVRTLEKYIELYDLPENFFIDISIEKFKLMKKKKESKN